MLTNFLEWLDYTYLHIGSFGGWIVVVLLGYEAVKVARTTRRR